MGYDRAITVFSPEGRLYQVEYATEAVRHGPLAVGVKAKDGVVLVGEKRSPHNLVDLSTLKKLLLIDDHVGTAIAGLHADARKLIDQARVKAQINRLSYDEPISIQSLVVDICDTKQMHTQYGGVRPFGVSLLVAGVDDHGPRLRRRIRRVLKRRGGRSWQRSFARRLRFRGHGGSAEDASVGRRPVRPDGLSGRTGRWRKRAERPRAQRRS